MGTINGNYETKSIEPKTLLLGGNEFETGVLNVAAAGEGETILISDGTLLTRAESGKYVVAEEPAAGDALFVLVDHVITPITAAGDYPVRVCVKGDVNRNLVTIGGDALTDAQVDLLRQNGIWARDVHEVI